MHLTRNPIPSLGCALALAVAPLFAQTAVTPRATKAAEEETLTLSPFEVVSDADVGYLATNSTSATRFNVRSRDLPISIQTITSELLRDQALVDLNEALSATVVGLQPGGIPRQSIIRGMASDYPLRNGVPTFGIQDIAYVDRIEIVKGPGATLYGVTQPGGVRNLMSKMPTFKAQFGVYVRLDSDGRQRTEIDLRGPVFTTGKFGKLAYRLIGVYDEYAKFADFQSRHDRLLYPAILWQPRPGTKIFYEYDYKFFNTNGSTGFLQVRVPGETFNRQASAANFGTQLPYTFNVAGQSPQQYQRVRVSNLYVDQSLGDVWSARATYSWQPYERYQPQYVQQTTIAPGAKTFNNIASVGVQRFRQEFARFDLLANVKRESFTNRTLIGGDYLWRLNRTWTYRDATRNATTGLYAQRNILLNIDDYYTPTFANNWLYDFADFTQKQPLLSLNQIWDVTAGAYVVDQLAFNKNRTFILGGLRYDRIKTITKTEVNNFRPAPGYANPVGTRVSPQIGISQRLSEGISAYANYSTSVFGNSQVNPDGTGFAPQYASGWDAGFKAELFNNKLSGNMAVFQTDNKNLPIADPAALDDPARVGYFILQGKTRAQGFDTNFTLTPRPGWQIVAGYTYIDAYNVLTDLQLTGTAKNSINLWTRYSVKTGMFKGLSFGGGNRWRSKLYRGVAQELYRAEITITDLFASYDTRLLGHRWTIQTNVRNLFNERQINDFSHPFGDGTNYVLSLRMDY